MIKMSKNKSNKICALIILVTLLSFSYIHLFIAQLENQNPSKEMIRRPRTNGFWNLTGSPIFIDGNDDWEDQNALYDWISGSGLPHDPFIIENVVIDGLNTNSCITIKNSNVHFTIRNCTFYNSDLDYSAGLILNNVSKGLIFNNNVSRNGYYGILLENCEDIIISHNNVSFNTESGIIVYDSGNTTVTTNRVENNGWNGIEIASSGVITDANLIINNIVSLNTRGIYVYSDFTKILNNVANDNLFDGIYINCEHVLVMGNTANLNQDGLYLSWHDNNSIIENSFNDNSMHGITIWHSSFNYISNNNISGNTKGIYMYSFSRSSINNTIIGNRMIENEYGIHMEWNNFNNTITGNLITNCSSYGIYLTKDCDWNYIENNIIYYSDGLGIFLFDSCDFNIMRKNNILNNTGSGNSDILAFSSTNNQMIENNCSNNEYYGIHIYNSQYTIIKDNCFLNEGIAVYSESSNYSVIQGNDANNCTQASGMLFYNSWYNEVFENKVNNNNIGIILNDESNFNEIHDNQVLDNKEYGIYIIRTEYNTISSNVIANSVLYYGLYLEESHNVNISLNTIELNHIGICFVKSNESIISHNLIKNNAVNGVLLKSDGTGCSDNLFYNNFFIGNHKHAVDEQATNYWNNSIIGNYWDNYTGFDVSPQDGIGDTPYNFPGGTDYLPIWDESAPIISILSPVDLSYGSPTAPSFIIMVEDLYPDSIWYTIDGGFTNVLFYTNGSIIQALWDSVWNSIDEGDTISIYFYANDTFGQIGFNSIDIIKVIAPIMNIISPTNNQVIGSTPPSFVIEIIEDNIDTIWYSLDNGVTIYQITTNGTIDANLWSNIWNSLSDEDVVTIIFYVNDTYGLSAFDQVQIIIDKPTASAPSIPGYNWGLWISLFTSGLIIINIFRKRKT